MVKKNNKALKKVDKTQKDVKNLEILINRIKSTIEIIVFLTALINLFNKNVKCLVIKTLTGSLYCNINDNIYVLEEVKEFETFSSEFDYDIVKEKKILLL